MNNSPSDQKILSLMTTSKIRFNRNRPRVGASIDTPSQELIENTPTLARCSIEDAAVYGGTLTREALGAMQLRGDRRYIIVDTKVHHLLPGFIPSIPGWHTDGVPRGESGLNPNNHGEPNLRAQVEADEDDAPRYHLLVTGSHAPTEFFVRPWTVDLVNWSNLGSDLYREMTREVNAALDHLHRMDTYYAHEATWKTPENTVVEWDWWNIHRATPATARGWRFLIRVTETDHIEPRRSPNDFIRRQNMVYAPVEFGW